MPYRQNHLLAMLAPDDLAPLRPHLRTVEMVHAHVLAESHQKIEVVHFPHSGVISFVVEMKDGRIVETGMTGRDGVSGASQALDGKVSLNKIVVQVAGEASAIDADRLCEAAAASPVIRALIVRYDQFFTAQIQQSVACNASHEIRARMCRWLLRMRDLVDDDFILTQEFLSQMLGVRRSSVSEIATTLQEAGLIRYARGHMHIADVDGLRRLSCECYADVCSHHQRIFGTRVESGGGEVTAHGLDGDKDRRSRPMPSALPHHRA
jgi:CRP-like cAMP-binding protein